MSEIEKNHQKTSPIYRYITKNWFKLVVQNYYISVHLREYVTVTVNLYPFSIHVHRKCNEYMFYIFLLFFIMGNLPDYPNFKWNAKRSFVSTCTMHLKTTEKVRCHKRSWYIIEKYRTQFMQKKIIIISYHFLSKLLYSYVSLDRCCL